MIRMLAKLPGFGPRSARRAALYCVKNKDSFLEPLAASLLEAARSIRTCSDCGNLDTVDPCGVCSDNTRDRTTVCVVEDVADMWALERTASFDGTYHILGGTLSALDGRGPEDLRISELVSRVTNGRINEVILALSATVEGQTTAHYVSDRLEALPLGLEISGLAHGVPIGGELDYLDDGTLSAAIRARRPI